MSCTRMTLVAFLFARACKLINRNPELSQIPATYDVQEGSFPDVLLRTICTFDSFHDHFYCKHRILEVCKVLFLLLLLLLLLWRQYANSIQLSTAILDGSTKQILGD